MNSNNKTQNSTSNLLQDEQFQLYVQFQSNYAIGIKGGHVPTYFSTKQKTRLVNDINFLTQQELQQVVSEVYLSKN
jgi:hypothetical protein